MKVWLKDLRNRTFFTALIAATFFALGIRCFVLEDFRISSASMSPVLLQGDLVFVNKALYNLTLPFSDYVLFSFKRPKAGDVVVFGLPEKSTETFVKRVIANEGERVEIKDGTIFVNDVAARYTRPEDGTWDSPEKNLWAKEELPGNNHPYVVRRISSDNHDFGPVDVPKGHFFALGDNRSESIDSRSWGPVPYTHLKGRVGLVWMSVGEKSQIRSDRIGTWVN